VIDTLLRAFRGTARSPVRTVLVVLLLAAGLSFALTSLALAFAADDELNKIKQTTGVEAGVSVNPDQFQSAIQGEFDRSQRENVPFDSNRIGQSVTFLTTEQADEIAALPYVRRTEVFTVAAPEYELLDRPARQENDLVLGQLRIALPDAVVTGTKDAAFLPDFTTGIKKVRDGRLFTADDAGKDVVVIDQNTAAIETLKVGDKLVLKQQVVPPAGVEPPAEPEFQQVEAEIIGIFADLNTASQGGFSPAQIEAWYAPIDMVRKLQAEDSRDTVTAISIVYDSVDSGPRLRQDLADMFDPDLFVVTTSEKRFEDISDPVETMRSSSLLVTIAGLAVVGLIMVMLMALVIRGRLREIGILKAVGARNRHVILQFALETLGIAGLAVLIAVPTVLVTNSVVTDALRPSATVKAQSANDGGGNGPDLGAGSRALTDAPIIDDPVRTEERKAVLSKVDATVDPQIIALAAAIAGALGLLGALVPIVAVLRLRPAEVLRLEA